MAWVDLGRDILEEFSFPATEGLRSLFGSSSEESNKGYVVRTLWVDKDSARAWWRVYYHTQFKHDPEKMAAKRARSRDYYRRAKAERPEVLQAKNARRTEARHATGKHRPMEEWRALVAAGKRPLGAVDEQDRARARSRRHKAKKLAALKQDPVAYASYRAAENEKLRARRARNGVGGPTGGDCTGV